MGLKSYNSWEEPEQAEQPNKEPVIICYRPDNISTEGFPWHCYKSGRYSSGHVCLEHALNAQPHATIDRESYYRWEGTIDRLISGKLV